MDNFRYATESGITCVLKTIILPKETSTIGKKVKRLRGMIPDGSPLLTWPYIEGYNFPYHYSKEQKKIVFETAEFRRYCQKHYMDGAGWHFDEMECSAGEGFFVMFWGGNATRCYSCQHQGMGSLVNRTIKMSNSPKICGTKRCNTPFWGLWFGVKPWKHLKDAKEEDAHYCRWGPEYDFKSKLEGGK